MKKLTWLLSTCLLLCAGADRLQAQTARFNFTASPASIGGWNNLSGDPSITVQTATDAATGISISSIATANWHPYNGGSSFDGLGTSNGSFFPAAVMANHWFQYDGSVSVYNAAQPQLQLTGLKPNTLYTLRMAGSSTSELNSNTRYTIAGNTVYDYQDINSHNNTVDGAVFNNAASDPAGSIKIYINPQSTADVGDISGLEVSPAASYWSVTGNSSIAPASNFLGTTDNNALSLRTNNSERMRVQPNGNVLIGKATDDGGMLQVGGAINIDNTNVQVPLSIQTDDIYSTWLEYSNTNTAVGASVGTRFSNANGLVAQFFAGGPTLPFMPNGFAFHDISGGGFDFVSANPTGFISWGNNFKNFGGSRMIFYPTSGNLLIGSTVDNGSRLQVNGTIATKTIKVTQTGWPDYVFGHNYRLLPLSELERYIKTHQHLPEIQSAAQVQSADLDLGENQAALLKKVEELTLYMIELNKKVDRLMRENETLKKGKPHINSYKTK